MDARNCNKCGKGPPEVAFYFSRPDCCKGCVIAAAKAYRAAHREERLAYDRRRNSSAEYRELRKVYRQREHVKRVAKRRSAA